MSCGNLVQSKQIQKIMAASVMITGFSSTVSVSNIVTTPISTALSSAGAGGTSVPLQVSANDLAMGIITTAPNNRVEIWDDVTKMKLQDGSGNEVYGRITEAGGVYTLSYYSLVGGVQTAFTMDGRDLTYTFHYRFDFKRYPGDAATLITSRNVNDDPLSGLNGRYVTEEVPVTALNTVTNLSYIPSDVNAVRFDVNGVTYTSISGSPFSVSGVAVTWNATTGQYNLETTDCVVASYFTMQGI